MLSRHEPVLVREVVRRGAADLLASGVQGARREALHMWIDLFDITLAQLVGDGAALATGEQVERFWAAVAKRRSGHPLPYVTGKAAFRHLDLHVDGRVLIPRPETEGLVEIVLDRVTARVPRSPAPAGLEIGTGSGCIVLSLATEGSFARLVATDVSDEALDIARTNARRTAPEAPIEFRHGTFYGPVTNERFDVIVSNPPYISRHEYPRLDVSVRHYEPTQALMSGEGGMFHIRSICENARDHLRPGGVLALEIDSRRAWESQEHAVRAGLQNVTVQRDLFGRPRYLVATMPH